VPDGGDEGRGPFWASAASARSRLPFGLDQLEARAREVLSRSAYGYLCDAAYGGADESRSTARANERAWGEWWLRPRVLVDVSATTPATTVLGQPVALPVLAAPCAFNDLAHPEAELAVARATARVGTLQIVSSGASKPPGEIFRAGRGDAWFQLYADVDPGMTDERVRTAEAAGFRALVLTVDAPVGAPRYHGYPEKGFGPVATATMLNPKLDWREVERIASRTRLPLLLKGVLHPEDARIAVERGAAALVVSNHGGRQLDGALPTAFALAPIVDAVAGRCEVYVDGGIRSARDVLRALALGARAVLVGRPYVFALALAGEDGVVELFERLREELANALMLVGCPDPTCVPRDVVVARPR
jgi:isopentenyl diphosphate isomerase/L-lactate dehydrogenase-like FMN-dependent dehydrogenase